MGPHFRRLTAAAVAIVGCVTAGTARADPILVTNVTVTSGSAVFLAPLQQNAITIFGDQGFSLTGFLGIFGAFQPHCCPPPGATVRVAGTWGGGDVRSADVSILGHTFNNVGSVSFLGTVLLQFDGGLITLPPLSDSATVQTPFMFTGLFRTPPLGGDPRGEIITANLTGRGIGTLFLARNGSEWRTDEARFEFTADQEPIPEPSTMLLTGGALLSAYGIKRRRRRSEKETSGSDPSSPTASEPLT